MLLKAQVDGSVDLLPHLTNESLPRRAGCGWQLFFRHTFLFQARSQLRFPATFFTISLLSLSELPAKGAVLLAIGCRNEVSDADINTDDRCIWFSLEGNRLIVGKRQPPDLIPLVERDAAVDLPAFAGFQDR